MSGRVIHAKRKHHCNPGWHKEPFHDPVRGTVLQMVEDRGIQEGDVWACNDCGKTWVAHTPQYSNMIFCGVKFYPEGRIARWRRERKQHVT